LVDDPIHGWSEGVSGLFESFEPVFVMVADDDSFARSSERGPACKANWLWSIFPVGGTALDLARRGFAHLSGMKMIVVSFKDQASLSSPGVAGRSRSLRYKARI